MFHLFTQSGEQANSQIVDLLSNRVVIAVIAAVVGIIISGVVNYLLQWLQDNRRFKNERTIQKERWEREATVQQQRWSKEDEDQRRRWEWEDETQKRRWEREDRLRNYEERRRTYIEVMRVTDNFSLVHAQQNASTESAMEYSDIAARLRGELRMLAPFEVRGAGEYALQSFLACVYAHLGGSGEVEAKWNELKELRFLFMVVAQNDLGLTREEDKKLLQHEYKDIQDEKSESGRES